MIESKAFRTLSYGLFIASSQVDGKNVGCICNTFAQVTSEPLQTSVCLNKENTTTKAIQKSGKLSVTVLSEDASMELIGMFGFHSSAEEDKFAGYTTKFDEQGMPYVEEGAVALFSLKVVNTVDLGTHLMFICEVVQAEKLVEDAAVMTYAYYHAVKGGKTPPRASSYLPESIEPKAGEMGPKVGWRCMLCGYIEYVDELPADFMCPICGASRDLFEKTEQ